MLILFGASVLLPQGVGFNLPAGLPNLDLPRLAVIGALVLFLGRLAMTGRFDTNGARRTIVLMTVFAIWQTVSASQSESARGAMMWAFGNILTMTGLAVATVSIAGGRVHRERGRKILTTIALMLAVWSVYELITQTKVFPTRNLWSGSEGVRFSTTLRRLIPGSAVTLPYMSIGPYALNLALGSALCALGGFLLIRKGKGQNVYKAHLLLFVLGVVATQSRAAIGGMVVMLVINALWMGGRRERRVTFAMALVMILGLLWMGGARLRLAFDRAWMDALEGTASQSSFGTRWEGLQLLAQQVDTWWLFGFGPGSLFDADRVRTGVAVMGDPGSYFAFFAESGLVVGVVLTIVVARSIRQGFHSQRPEARAGALGLTGFWITSLSSLTPWVWPVAVTLAGLVESWVRTERREIAAARLAQAETVTPRV